MAIITSLCHTCSCICESVVADFLKITNLHNHLSHIQQMQFQFAHIAWVGLNKRKEFSHSYLISIASKPLDSRLIEKYMRRDWVFFFFFLSSSPEARASLAFKHGRVTHNDPAYLKVPFYAVQFL